LKNISFSTQGHRVSTYNWFRYHGGGMKKAWFFKKEREKSKKICLIFKAGRIVAASTILEFRL